MDLCVGAVSLRVIEEAAKLQVHQIIASRRQVDVDGGYTGLNQRQLVDLVHGLSYGKTEVVRDHGGPLQGHGKDNGVESLDFDVAAGFTGLHLDVSKLPRQNQKEWLIYLVNRYGGRVKIEVGGEHDAQRWNEYLVQASIIECGVDPTYGVMQFGAKIWNDRQVGRLLPPGDLRKNAERWHHFGVKTKAHNMDWLEDRAKFGDYLDAYNVAPEFAQVETDALLQVLDEWKRHQLLSLATKSNMWQHWFKDDEGTWDERARCAVRYVANTDAGRELTQVTSDQDAVIRERIRDALQRG